MYYKWGQEGRNEEGREGGRKVLTVIEKTSKAGGMKAVWLWQADNNGAWLAYDLVTCVALEDAYTNKLPQGRVDDERFYRQPYLSAFPPINFR